MSRKYFFGRKRCLIFDCECQTGSTVWGLTTEWFLHMLAWTKSVPELRWLGLGLTKSPIPKRLTTVFDIREYCCWRHLLCKHIPTKNVGMACLVDAGAIILPILLHGWKKTDRRRSSTPHFLFIMRGSCEQHNGQCYTTLYSIAFEHDDPAFA